MAAPYNPPYKNQEFKIPICLVDKITGDFKVNPTIAAGDFKVTTAEGAVTDLATTPTVSPAGSIWVVVTVSASEMNGDIVGVQGIDQSDPKEWDDIAFGIPTPAVP